MNEKQLHALAAEFAKNLKTPEDLNQFSRMLKQITVESALNGELTDHLGYEKHQPRKGKNARNGYTSKTVICDEGEIEIETPRDRDGTFEPQLIKKNQTHITGMDEQIIALYAKGLSNQEIVEMF
ncbi:transposase, partial [Glaesserella parasuis]|uniref:transposase n=1 Tax=Glaesserella parasuis TaxID=738 RepID=UPI003B682931